MHKSKGASRSDWQTPESTLLLVRATIGGPIALDPATAPDNPTRALEFYTPAEDGLTKPWSASSIFLNPPWSRKDGVDHTPWLRRAQEARDNARGRNVFHMFVCISAAMNASWFHAYLSDMDTYFFPKGRVKYEPPEFFLTGDSPGFDSVLCYAGTAPERFSDVCKGHGLVTRRVE